MFAPVSFQDSIQLSDFALTSEGFLLSKARIARSGIQVYRAGEPGMRDHFGDRDPNDEIRVYRPPEEVFSDASLASIAGKTVTIDHPGEFVNSKNVKDLAVGFIGDAVRRDGEFVAGTIRILHEDGIKAVRDGQLELSVGYDLDLEVVSGHAPDGQAYDAIQRNIRANHVALVVRGRCGSACRVHDRAQDTRDDCNCAEDTMATQLVDCGGNMVEMGDAARIAVSTLVDSHALDISLRDATASELKQKIADLEGELATATAKHEDAAAKLADALAQVTPEAMDTAAKARVIVVDSASKLAPALDVSKLGTPEIKRAVLAALDVKIEGRTDEFIDAAFDTRAELATDAKPVSEVARQLAAASGGSTNDADDARTAYLTRTSASYKRGGE